VSDAPAPFPAHPCTVKALPPHLLFHAAADAITLNPANAVMAAPELLFHVGGLPSPLHAAALTSKMWPATGVELTVAFLEPIGNDLADRLLSHFNAWNARGANLLFRRTNNLNDAAVRVTRDGSGYWSYIGTDIRSVPRTEPTMSLQGFTMQTLESEFRRVGRHEPGHTLALIHEHSRKAIVDQLNPAAVLPDFKASQGWSEAMIYQQILTPEPESALTATNPADAASIMAYWFQASLTYSHQPIVGGTDINDNDYSLINRLFPPRPGGKPPEPPAPPTPPPAPTGDLHPLTLGGPPVAVQTPAGGRARYRLTLASPQTFTLLCGAIGGTPTVAAGRRGGTLGTSVPLKGGAAAVRAAAGDWEFVVATSAPAGGLVYLRAVPFGTAALRDVAPVEFC
jgi:hypothetical protein